MKLDLCFTTFTKIKDQLHQRFKHKALKIKLLEENVRSTSIGSWKRFFNRTPKIQTTKETKKWSYIKLKSSAWQKKQIKQSKWKGSQENGRKISAHHISDKGWICRIYEEFIQLSNKKTSNWIKNGERVWINISPKTHRWPTDT